MPLSGPKTHSRIPRQYFWLCEIEKYLRWSQRSAITISNAKISASFRIRKWFPGKARGCEQQWIPPISLVFIFAFTNANSELFANGRLTHSLTRFLYRQNRQFLLPRFRRLYLPDLIEHRCNSCTLQPSCIENTSDTFNTRFYYLDRRICLTITRGCKTGSRLIRKYLLAIANLQEKWLRARQGARLSPSFASRAERFFSA